MGYTTAKYKEGKNIRLPIRANPINFKGPRDCLCRFYENCLEYILQSNPYCDFFSCIDCEKASKSIKARRQVNMRSADFDICDIAPALKKRVKSKRNSGKRMGYKVIQQKN